MKWHLSLASHPPSPLEHRISCHCGEPRSLPKGAQDGCKAGAPMTAHAWGRAVRDEKRVAARPARPRPPLRSPSSPSGRGHESCTGRVPKCTLRPRQVTAPLLFASRVGRTRQMSPRSTRTEATEGPVGLVPMDLELTAEMARPKTSNDRVRGSGTGLVQADRPHIGHRRVLHDQLPSPSRPQMNKKAMNGSTN